MMLALLVACVIGGEKYPQPGDLEPDWSVNRPRLLAVAAEPPEAAPGEAVTFSSLVADPRGEIALQVWTVCPPEAADDQGCSLDFSAIGDDPTPEELAALGVIAIQPPMTPTWTPGPELLDGVEDRAEGVYATVQVAAFPASALDDTSNVDFSTVEVGFKRLVVSEALTPNTNPRVSAFQVDGQDIPDGAVVEVDAGERYVLTVVVDPTSVESYVYVGIDDLPEDRVEDPYTTWYASGGTLGQSLTLHPTHDVDWYAPDEPGIEGSWWAVIRDRRGGLVWRSQRWRAR